MRLHPLIACLLLGPGGCYSRPLEQPAESNDGDSSDGTGGTTPGTSGSSASTSGGTSSADATTPTSPPDTSLSETNMTQPTSGTNPSTTESTEGSTSSGLTAEDGSTGCVPDCSDLVCDVDPICGAPCGQCEGAAECKASGEYCGLAIGWPDSLGFSGNAIADLIFGHRITLDNPATLRRIGAITGEAGNTIQMALYSHQGGPQVRLAETGTVLIVSGINEFDVPETSLAAGDYWIALLNEETTEYHRTDDTDFDHEAFYLTSSWANGFPATLSTETLAQDYQYNVYIVVEEQ